MDPTKVVKNCLYARTFTNALIVLKSLTLPRPSWLTIPVVNGFVELVRLLLKMTNTYAISGVINLNKLPVGFSYMTLRQINRTIQFPAPKGIPQLPGKVVKLVKKTTLAHSVVSVQTVNRASVDYSVMCQI